MNLGQLQKQGIQELQKVGISEPRRKINRLLGSLLGTDSVGLMKQEKEEVKKELEIVFENSLQQLKEGYPIQYLTHHQEFMKLPFYVDESVLIPQPDTEILVEETLKELEKREKVELLDLCTGSGCVGISIAVYAKSVQKIVLSDISKEALDIAKRNVRQNQVEKKVELIQSNLFMKIQRKFDGIVSNPPYIQTEIIEGLSKEVQAEPKLALDGGEDGLFFYRNILAQADQYLKPGGFLFLEIGYDQKEAVKQIWKDLREKGKTNLSQWNERKDYAGLDRVVLLRSEA